METPGIGFGARGAPPAPNAGKIVKVRWVKRYAEAENHVCIGEIVRETDWYLVMRGFLISFKKGDQEVRKDEECVRWIPWPQIAAVTELQPGLKWREVEFRVNEVGKVSHR